VLKKLSFLKNEGGTNGRREKNFAEDSAIITDWEVLAGGIELKQ
jgi:hypothetical protein